MTQIIMLQNKPEYRKNYIPFDRFSFDIISLMGINLLRLKPDQIELVIRMAFHSITFNYNGRLQLLDQDQIESAWDN